MLQDLRCCKRMRFMMLSVTAAILSALALAAVAGGLSIRQGIKLNQFLSRAFIARKK
jgi:hypothetical protein